jgi:glycosyltransferase involved in cell wall biosynthesis
MQEASLPLSSEEPLHECTSAAQAVPTKQEQPETSIDELLHQIHHLRARNIALEQHLHSITSSRSWRITRPIRLFSELRRKIFPLWRFTSCACTLTPSRNIQVSQNAFEITGPTPILTVKPEGELPSGWVLISASIATPMIFSLYYRTGAEFTEHEKAHFAFLDTPRSRKAVYLPPGIKELRLQPFACDGRLDIRDVSFQALGTAQHALEILKRQFGPGGLTLSAVTSKAKKAIAIYKEGGLYGLKIKLFTDTITGNYQEWVKKYDTINEDDRRAMKEGLERFSYKPTISIVMPTYNTGPQYLREAIESVRAQSYPHWELCIADDASTSSATIAVLKSYASEPRIKVHYREKNGHISRASNDALKLCTGDYVALLDHDDTITEDALFSIVATLQGDKKPALIYSDEDMITGFGMRYNPHFKSDWNPYLFTCQNYVCHLTTIKRSLIESLGGFRVGVEGAQDWDLFLRVTDQVTRDEIVHIPQILYHWRSIPQSTASSTGAKPYVLEAQAKAMRDHFERREIKAEVSIDHAISHLRPHFALPQEKPLVSILIPTKDQLHHLERCVESIYAKSDYRNFEIIIVDNGSTESATLSYLADLERTGRAQVLRVDEPFNYSRLNNLGAQRARGSLLCLMNNDLEVITPGWLSELVSVVLQQGVGITGARLLYPNGLLQHGGVILGIGGVAGHNSKGRRREDPGYFNRAILLQNLSAVTAACLVVRRSVFDEVGGLDEKDLTIGFNDVDFCLRVGARGYDVVYVAYAELYHFESASRGYETTPEKFKRFEGEVRVMKNRWRERLARDPYYNPNLTLLTEDFQVAFPTRVVKPWIALQNVNPN